MCRHIYVHAYKDTYNSYIYDMLHGHGHTHMDATRQHVCLICKPDTCHNSMIGVSLLCMHTLHACIYTCIHMYRGIRNCMITLRNPSGEVNVSHTMRDTNVRGCARTDKYTHTHTHTERDRNLAPSGRNWK